MSYGTFEVWRDDLESFDDVEKCFEKLLSFFGGNVADIYVSLGRYLDKVPQLPKGKRNSVIFNDHQFWKDTFAELDDLAPLEVTVSEPEKKEEEKSQDPQLAAAKQDLQTMQSLRRRSSVMKLKTTLESEEGRKMSSVEKSAVLVDSALNLAMAEDAEDAALEAKPDQQQQEEEEEEDEAEVKNWKYLPYAPIPGNEIDEAIGEQVNVFEIDVKIRRLGNQRNRNKARYRVEKNLYEVKCIHGVLICKRVGKGGSKNWMELMPLLRKLAGQSFVYGDEAAGGAGPFDGPVPFAPRGATGDKKKVHIKFGVRK